MGRLGSSRRRAGGGREGPAGLRGYKVRPHALAVWPKEAHGLLAIEAGGTPATAQWLLRWCDHGDSGLQ
jgi:hypothetical protein